MTTKIKIAVITATIVILTGIIALLVGCHRSRQVANTPTTEENSCEYNSENNTDNTTAGNTEESTTKADDQPTTEPTEEDSQPSTEESHEEVTTKEPVTNPQEPTTTKAPETTAPTVAPTTPPTAAPTVAPTQEPTTEAVKVHGKDGVILDTLYFHYLETRGGLWQVPDTSSEYITIMEEQGKVPMDVERGLSKTFVGSSGYADFLGIGLIIGESTEADVKEYFGNPYYRRVVPGETNQLYYYYKDSGLLIKFAFLDSDNSLYSVYVGLRDHFDYVTDEHLYKE